MKLLTKVTSIFDRIIDFLAVVALALIAFMMLSVVAEVSIMRLLLNRPQAWVVDVTSQSLLFITFLGTAWLLREEGHVKMDLVLTRLSPRAQVVMNTIMSVVGTIICLVVAWYGARASWDHFQMGSWSATAMAIPRAPLLAVIPVGSFLLSLQFMRRTYGYLRRWRAPMEERLKVRNNLSQ